MPLIWPLRNYEIIIIETELMIWVDSMIIINKTPTECTVHDVLSVLCNSAVVQEATHACVSVVGVHRSVTTSRIIDPQPNFPGAPTEALFLADCVAGHTGCRGLFARLYCSGVSLCGGLFVLCRSGCVLCETRRPLIDRLAWRHC